MLARVGSFLYGLLGRCVISSLMTTCRVQVFGEQLERAYKREHPEEAILVATYHRSIVYGVYHYRHQKFVVMTSMSKDGQIASRIAHAFGWVTARGSSSIGGSTAFRQMLSRVREGHSGCILVDAPRGPRHVSKKGIIALAKKSGRPILPVMWWASRRWRTHSWDGTIIPKPFSRIVVLYGDELIRVPETCTDEEMERYRQDLDATLNRLMYQTDRFFTTPGVSDPRDIVVEEPAPLPA